MNKIGTKQIETERLILRRFEIEDAQNMFDNWASDYENIIFLTWPKHESVEVTKNVIERWLKEYEDNAFKWAITLKENISEVIGDISVVRLDETLNSCSIGYVLSKKYWNLGYVSEALKSVIEYLIKEANFNRIEAIHAIDNIASGKVMKKAGMKFEGILRQSAKSNNGISDVAVYSILKEEY